MSAFEVTYLGRSRFHEGRDAATLYFRVMRGGRYIGAYAGAVGGPDLVVFGPKPPRAFWASLAHVASTAIGVRLIADATPSADPHLAETIWIRSAEIRTHMDEDLPLPSEDTVFREFELEEDVLGGPEQPQGHILSAGSPRIGLKDALSRSH